MYKTRKRMIRTAKNGNNENYEEKLVEKLKKAEQQIKDGEVTDSETVFKKMREKYGY